MRKPWGRYGCRERQAVDQINGMSVVDCRPDGRGNCLLIGLCVSGVGGVGGPNMPALRGDDD